MDVLSSHLLPHPVSHTISVCVHVLCNSDPPHQNLCTSASTHRAEVGVLSDVVRHGLVTGRGGHDQQQRVPGLLPDGSVPVDERHQEGEDQQVGGALLGRCGSEQHL